MLRSRIAKSVKIISMAEFKAWLAENQVVDAKRITEMLKEAESRLNPPSATTLGFLGTPFIWSYVVRILDWMRPRMHSPRQLLHFSRSA